MILKHGADTRSRASKGAVHHPSPHAAQIRDAAVSRGQACPPAPQPRRHRPGRGELHLLHALCPRVPRLVHLHRLPQGDDPRPRGRPPPPAERPRPLRHRLQPVHVLRDMHRGLPVRRPLLVSGVRVRGRRHPQPHPREGQAGRLDPDRSPASGPRPGRRAAEGAHRRPPPSCRPYGTHNGTTPAQQRYGSHPRPAEDRAGSGNKRDDTQPRNIGNRAHARSKARNQWRAASSRPRNNIGSKSPGRNVRGKHSRNNVRGKRSRNNVRSRRFRNNAGSWPIRDDARIQHSWNERLSDDAHARRPGRGAHRKRSRIRPCDRSVPHARRTPTPAHPERTGDPSSRRPPIPRQGRHLHHTR